MGLTSAFPHSPALPMVISIFLKEGRHVISPGKEVLGERPSLTLMAIYASARKLLLSFKTWLKCPLLVPLYESPS